MRVSPGAFICRLRELRADGWLSGDDKRRPKVSTESASEKAEFTKDVNQSAAELRATTNPNITSSESLQHCEDTGFKLAEFLSKGGITVDQRVFLSSPSNRALTTSDRVFSGIKRFCELSIQYPIRRSSVADARRQMRPQMLLKRLLSRIRNRAW